MGHLTGPAPAVAQSHAAVAPVVHTAGLADALFTTTQQRVLGLLFGHPERSFYVSEIVARTRGGTGALQRELRRLSAAGLITVRAIGNQRHYQASHDAPVFHELVQIVRKTMGVADPVREALSALEEQISLALLYGSMAKGTDTAASDIDLLVVSDTLTLEALYRALAPAEESLGRRVHPTLYSTAEYRKRRQTDQSFVSRVLAGDTVILIGAPDAIAGPR